MGDRSRLNRAGRRALARQERRTSRTRKVALSGGVALTLGGSLVASTPAQAATFTVTTNADDPASEETETTLREAIAAANAAAGPDVIVFESDVSGTIQLEQGQLVVTDDLTITPPPSGDLTVNAEEGYRVFYLQGDYDDPIAVAIGGISITNGQALGGEGQSRIDGGNILAVYAGLALDDVTVSGGTAADSGGGIGFFGYYDSTAGLTIVDSTITGNAAQVSTQDYTYYGGGGGIYVDGATGVVITDSAITNNETTFSGDGGGLNVANTGAGETVITGSTFTGNVAGAQAGQYYPGGNEYGDPLVQYYADGGAIYMEDDLTLSGTNVVFNTAADDGGGVVVEDNDATITDSAISGNTSLKGDGGGFNGDDADIIAITDSYVLNNDAYYDGGGIYVDQDQDYDEPLTIAGTIVSGNTAGDIGGGVASEDSTNFTVVDSQITNNVSGARGEGGEAGGGGIHVSELAGPLTVQNSSVSGNTAEGGDGGGLAVFDGYDYVYNGEATNAPVLITDSTFQNNSATYDGGGIYLLDIEGDVTIARTTVTSNAAGGKYDGDEEDGGRGGGVFISGVSLLTGEGATPAPAEVLILDSDISANSAKYGAGAAIRDVTGNVTVQGSSITGNDAALIAGGLAVTDIYAWEDEGAFATVTIADSAISTNTTKYAVGGAGIQDVEGDVVVTGSTISNNDLGGKYFGGGAGGAGGLGVSDVRNVTVDGTAITGNEARGVGGGAYVTLVNSLTITSTTVSGNSATGDGGGLGARFADNVVIADSTFDGNSAGSYGGGIEIEDHDESLSISNTAITNNTASDGGGLALDNVASDGLESAFAITNVLVSGNSASGDGGGIWLYHADTYASDDTPIVISTSTIRANQAGDDGGGIFAIDVRLGGEGVGTTAAPAELAGVVIDRSTLSGNLAEGDGGGVALNSSYADVVNSTVSGNVSGNNGGGIHLYSDSYATIRHSTIVENTATTAGGGIFLGDTSSAALDHVIVANNQPDDIAGSGPFIARFSLIETPPPGFVGAEGSDLGGNIVGVDPQLGPLQNNGGPTETHLPAPTSPVVNAGDPAFDPPPSTDQRGLAREVGVIDIGAVERAASGGGGGGGGGGAAATVQFSLAGVSVAENAGSATLTITRSSGAGSATVRVQSAPGTAVSPGDFTAVDVTVTFGDGETSKTVTVPIIDDFFAEQSETFTVTLSSPTNATLGSPATSTVTITDDSDVCSATGTHPFTDVSAANVHNASIACAFELDLTEGTSATTYSPELPVSRAQMATFIANVLEKVGFALPQNPPDAFDDDNGIDHERAINQLAALGIIQGTGGRTYNPTGNVSRGQMARFLVGAYEAVTGTDVAPQTDHFGDDNGSTFETDINTGFELGLFVGTSPTTYSPSVNVRRDQMATFLVRLVDALAEAGKPPVA
jgi:hypothetical protein